MMPIDKVLVPVDFSHDANEALDAAADLASRYFASLTIMNVLEPAAFVVLPESSGAYDHLPPSEAAREAAALLEKAKAKAIARGAKNVQIVQRRGYPPHEIVELARTGGYDLVVMGTHGRTGIKHMLIGSVAERVVRLAPCSVLTVRKR